jgi:RNA polymerase sigma-70 factor, ECF subfamily
MVNAAQSSVNDTQQIWLEFGDRLRAFIARRVGSEADAEDILQEVILRIHQHAEGVNRADRLTSWLFQVTRNAIADYYRAPVRRERLAGAPPDLEREGQPFMSWAAEGHGNPDGAARELATCLRPMVAQLPPLYREAVTLVDLEGLSQQEVAIRAGLSISGMKSRVQRGRRALAQVLHNCCRIELDATGRVRDYQHRGAGCSSCADGCGPNRLEHRSP